VVSVSDAAELVQQFLKDAHRYLKQRGLNP
jgi:hypothetical protein